MAEKKSNDGIFLIVIVIAVIGALILLARAVKKKGEEVVDNIQENVANTTVGSFLGIRTPEAEAAGEKIMRMPFLKKNYAEMFNDKYNTAAYAIPIYFDTTVADNIAKAVIDSNSLVPGGFFDDSRRATNELLKIKNQVEAVQVTFAYSGDSRTHGKNLGDGIQWLDNADLVRVADHFAAIPTGVYQNGIQLTELTV